MWNCSQLLKDLNHERKDDNWCVGSFGVDVTFIICMFSLIAKSWIRMDKLCYVESCYAMSEKLPEALQRQVPCHRAKLLGWIADGSSVATTCWDDKFQPFLCRLCSSNEIRCTAWLVVSGGHNTLNVNIHVMSTLARAVCDFALRVLSRFSGEEFRVEQRNGSFGCIPLGVGFVSSTCHICHSCNSRTSYPISHFYKVSLSLSQLLLYFILFLNSLGRQGINRWRIFISLASQLMYRFHNGSRRCVCLRLHLQQSLQPCYPSS